MRVVDAQWRVELGIETRTGASNVRTYALKTRKGALDKGWVTDEIESHSPPSQLRTLGLGASCPRPRDSIV